MNASEDKEEIAFEDLFLRCNNERSHKQDIFIGQNSSNIREYLIVKIEEDIINMIRAISNHQLGTSTYSLQNQCFSRKRRKAITSVQDYKSFARYLRVLESVYDALVQDTVITKRAIYYGDVELFGSQKVVDQIIEEVAANYRVPRHSLNIAAASKGLITGPMSIYLKDGTVLHCHCNPIKPVEGEPSTGLPVLIPSEGRIKSIQCDARLVLVVEKEVG
ncbi:hypothetical protein INT43_002529 [Umbelopsis isabellina]|uniref:Spo11/DNA topoisomerase VI subunit A N-terminal domain-containing protein n=1 Tax=Mortierella isabellina TaxID=91625 RepID=A0A8H7Q7C6_MORIS|nr:hypothetical protein INT43_002529 [Umbelopsis isabellina]